MEPRGQNGSRSDHDRGLAINGANGMGEDGSQPVAPDKDKMAAASKDSAALNGGMGATPASDASRQPASNAPRSSTASRSRMNDLPDEIIHITQGFIPLSLLLTRLAQTTHNSLQEKAAELAKMPLPAAAVNGNAANTSGSAVDDTSSENLRKKGNLATFAQDLHGKWLKALVITEWSRKSEMVSKLIDLKFHIDQQRILYDASLDNIVNVKRDLTFARMPSPDLKTALQVLSTGTAPWMPDLNYIDPPPLSPSDQLKWMNDLDTLLSLRLNIDDYDKIPHQFRNYDIGSGRVTFKVDGEFEVDLTIADEDFEKQFWFIDFRYAFGPAALSLPASLRGYLEGCVNEALSRDGLAGCYQFLHEFVLTSKINELKRQAMQLSRGAWSGTLTVEPLNRALAIQYWKSRTAVTGTKSWVLLGVNSGRKPNGVLDAKASSFIEAKWYRDNKEMKGNDIELDLENLSAESLLTHVVGRHIEFLLTSIHDKLLTAARFKNREASMALSVSRSEPAASCLSMQVGYDSRAILLVEPMTGVFAVKPHSKFTIQFEHQLNNGRNLAEDGANCLENVRCAIMEDELNRRGSSMGWLTRKSPLTMEEIRSVTKLREWTRVIWLQKGGWHSSWFVAVFLGLGGDEWWLLEVAAPAPTQPKPGVEEPLRSRNEAHRAVKFKTRLPLHKGHPDQSEAFWSNLALFTTGIITQSVDVRELHRHSIKSKSNDNADSCLSQQVRLPSIEISLAALFPSMVSALDGAEKRQAAATREGDLSAENIELFSLMQKYTGAALTLRQAWADNIILINFKGIQWLSPSAEGHGAESAPAGELICVSEAVIRVRRPTKFASLKEMVDRDVSYNPVRGEFSLRIRRPVGEPILEALRLRIKAIDRFVNFFEALANAGGAITSESMSLTRVTFRYAARPWEKSEESQAAKAWRASLDLSRDEIEVEVAQGNPHLRVLDLMRRLVNSNGGIGALMAWLPASLPALTAVNEMETKWDGLRAEKRGCLEFAMKTIAWISIGYDVASPKGKERRVTLDLRIKPRRGEAWWHVWRRPDENGAGPTADEFDRALKPIWSGKGPGWLGLATGAAGRPSGGVVAMLLAVDDAVRGVVGGSGIKAEPQAQSHDVVVLD
ncbi:hypothetical protein CDD83_9107 [Cordyceps sp. RAO-2017]|nr:hypothetical protein CDD83_9107 [Cordyceps sp. RAO-2017]